MHPVAVLLVTSLLGLSACSLPPPKLDTRQHLAAGGDLTGKGRIPDITLSSFPAPALPETARERYNVVVQNVPIQELLFALARDSKQNVDIHPGLTGLVSLNAVDQTLPQLLARLARQLDLRYEQHGDTWAVMPDTPFLRHYTIDYLSLNRSVSATVTTNTQIATTSANIQTGASNASIPGGNASTTRIENLARNQFWDTLTENIRDLLRENDKPLPEGASETVTENRNTQSMTGTGAPTPIGTARHASRNASPGNPTLSHSSNSASLSQNGTTVVRHNTVREAAQVIANPESGLLTVRASGRQHERIQTYLEKVLAAARRQVMIEATIVEVELTEAHQQGIEWSRLRSDGSGFALTPGQSAPGNDSSSQAFTLSYRNLSRPLNLAFLVRLLEAYGQTRVLSSPRLSVLNNQTALLKVVDNFVYFTVKADTTSTASVGSTTSVSTTPQSVSVGLVLSVTPQISPNDTITLNIRPTISSISGLKEDPNPSIPAGIKNFVPQIRTREIESILRIGHGDIAVLGGLMEDSSSRQHAGLPGLGSLPVLGELTSQRSTAGRKSELVIFLRPSVIREASLGGDYRQLAPLLPTGGNPPPLGS
ncbi:MAG: hypothetical protein RIR00_1709 [Pseudomonadota bacterium]